jgi:hypothetical protein
MDITATISIGALLAIFTAIQAWINNGRFNRLEGEMSSMRAENDARFAQLSHEIGSLRSDLLHVALDRRRED